MTFFYEPEFTPKKIELFLSTNNLTNEEMKDLYNHTKHLILIRLVENYLEHLDSKSDKVYFLSIVHRHKNSNEVFDFISTKVSSVPFKEKFAEIEEEILSILIND